MQITPDVLRATHQRVARKRDEALALYHQQLGMLGMLEALMKMADQPQPPAADVPAAQGDGNAA